MQKKLIWFFLGFFSVLVLFVFDRGLKFFFSRDFSVDLAGGGGGEMALWGDWLKLSPAYNTGVAFSLSVNYYWLLVFYFIIIFLLIWFLLIFWRKKDFYSVFGLYLMIAGAFSNLWDRLFFGYVIDYLQVSHFSVLNLADIMIVGGGMILVFAANFFGRCKKL